MFSQSSVENPDVLKTKLGELLERLPVSRVIFGWNCRQDVSQTIIETAHKHGAQALFCLPVFADNERPDAGQPLEPLRTVTPSAVQTCEGEHFRFLCPDMAENRDEAIASFEHLSFAHNVDGVFLDRIRYSSAVFSPFDFFGCHCSHCLEQYHKEGLDFSALRKKAAAAEDLRSFIPSALEKGCYHYNDPDLELLNRHKRQVMVRSVQNLTEYFHKKGLIVGIDTFAPALADLVGQDLCSLSAVVDFIKPMMYYHTFAPAGVLYELKAYGSEFSGRISALWKTEVDRPESVNNQLLFISGKADLTLGIEVNHVPGICEPKEEDYLSAVRAIEQAGCSETVISWNVLNAPKQNIIAIENVLRN